MNILFPTDFSENAELASQFAIDLKSRSNGKLFVFNSYDLPYSDRSMSTSLVEVMQENAEENMKSYTEKLRKEGIDAHPQVLMGNPIRVTKELIKKHNIDIVIMGTKGASGIEEFLIGSNAASVIHGVDVPVLVIPPQSKLTGIKNIVLASDLNLKEKERPLQRLKQFAGLYNARIDILSVRQDTDTNFTGNRDFAEKILGDTPHSYTVAEGDNVEKAILNHCENHHADIVAVIARRYAFFEGLFHQSLTSKLAYHTSIPLLALHEPK